MNEKNNRSYLSALAEKCPIKFHKFTGFVALSLLAATIFTGVKTMDLSSKEKNNSDMIERQGYEILMLDEELEEIRDYVKQIEELLNETGYAAKADTIVVNGKTLDVEAVKNYIEKAERYDVAAKLLKDSGYSVDNLQALIYAAKADKTDTIVIDGIALDVDDVKTYIEKAERYDVTAKVLKGSGYSVDNLQVLIEAAEADKTDTIVVNGKTLDVEDVKNYIKKAERYDVATKVLKDSGYSIDDLQELIYAAKAENKDTIVVNGKTLYVEEVKTYIGKANKYDAAAKVLKDSGYSIDNLQALINAAEADKTDTIIVDGQILDVDDVKEYIVKATKYGAVVDMLFENEGLER